MVCHAWRSRLSLACHNLRMAYLPTAKGTIHMSLPVDEQITFFYCEDMAQAAPFYDQVLGLELAVNQGSCRIYHVVGRKGYIGICERATPRAKDGVIFTIVTQDVDAWYERITAHGITCEN